MKIFLAFLIGFWCGSARAQTASTIAFLTASAPSATISNNMFMNTSGPNIVLGETYCDKDTSMKLAKQFEYADRFMILQAWGMKQ